ncbi:hypothetical protein ABN309_05680 [Providencia rettgeri]|uniref:hypothetical protein n=1 Tax=Providencia rettgeri TaxID=587 RepID=UPI0032DB03E5
MKRNIDDFDGMKDFIISIVGAVAWFLIGIIVIIGYFTIESKGESIILSFASTIFTIISSLGIVSTIVVYFKQKRDQEVQHNKYIKKKKESIKHLIRRCVSDFNYHMQRVESGLFVGDIEEARNQLIKINNNHLEKCLLDSKDVDFDMFYFISDLLDAINDQKDIIEKRVTSGLNKNPDYYNETIIYCDRAKREVNERYGYIIDC